MSDLVSYTLENKVAVVQMDDGKANALSKAMIEALDAALTRAEAEASAMVLTGRPSRFCGGFDLRVMMSGPGPAIDLLRAGALMLMRFYGASIPVVIACSGHALAGGALLVLTGDQRIGAAGAFQIGLNEVAVGLPVPVLAAELARDRLLPTEYVRATLQARIYDPEGALRAGYLDAVTSADTLLEEARAEAARLGALSRNAFRATKKRLRGKMIAHVLGTLDADVADLLTPAR
jgi:enoyl-CoA hydratase